MEGIFKHSPAVEVTQKAFDKTDGLLAEQALLKFQNLTFSISEEMIKEMVSGSSSREEDRLIRFLARLKSKVPITEDILLLAANSPSYAGSLMRILLDEKRPLNLQRFWECLWQSCCRYSEEVSDILLEYTSVEISRSMLEGIPSSESPTMNPESDYAEETCGFERINSFESRGSGLKNENDLLARLVWFLLERNFPIPQDVMEIIMQKSHFKTILTVLAHNPHLQISNEILNAAMRNPDFYDVMWILHILPLGSECENLNHVISLQQASGSCNLHGCWVVHSPEKRKERRDLLWDDSEKSSGLFYYWTV